ncbi:SgcJ/EcaC family oxidoreductase [Spirillospora sp. NPDC047279]|uniref:SgcJ/EcaC family oxidoreductase n=1 Tax=Spirillospora sp. NPDC047279 TaxID=3155478 RepID=UPI0034112D55
METTRFDEQAREAEIGEIKQVVATIQHAQQNELPGEFVGLFRADAIWTTAFGKRLTGREEISAFTHEVLPGAMRESTATYEVVHILFIRPDVAAVKVRQRAVTLDGRPIEGQNEGSPLYVMAKQDGRWLLTACQNTEVLGS